MNKKLRIIILLILLISQTHARITNEKVGDILQVILPTSIIGMTAYNYEWQATQQYSFALLSTIITTQTIKYSLSTTRPNGGGQSFPSGHTAAAASASSFAAYKYGYKIGIPFSILSGYVVLSRIEHEKHFLIDTIFGAIIATLFSKILYHDTDSKLFIINDKDGIYFSYKYKL